MAKVIAPNKNYNGESASVAFAAGVGYTDDERLLAWFREHGYTVEDDARETDKPSKLKKER